MRRLKLVPVILLLIFGASCGEAENSSPGSDPGTVVNEQEEDEAEAPDQEEEGAEDGGGEAEEPSEDTGEGAEENDDGY